MVWEEDTGVPWGQVRKNGGVWLLSIRAPLIWGQGSIHTLETWPRVGILRAVTVQGHSGLEGSGLTNRLMLLS